MTEPNRQRPGKRSPRIELPQGLRVRLFTADLLLIALAVGTVLYVAVFGLPRVPPTGVPLPPPAQIYGPPAPPLHDLHKIALVVAVVFGATLLSTLHPLAPLVKLLGRRWREKVSAWFGRDAVDCSWLHCTWLVFAPMLRQSSLRVATLVSGTVGIALWHHGCEGLALIRFLGTAGATFYVVGAAAALAVTARLGTAWRALGRSMSWLLFLYYAEQVAGWVL